MADEINKEPEQKKESFFTRLYNKGMNFWRYATNGVWRDPSDKFKVRAVKVMNISVRGFLSADLQTQACAMTYRTMLAVVPALALIFAIGRGFGLQNLLEKELYSYFPSQQKALEETFVFVDSYLNQASEGIFVGVGILFLLWTLINLLDSVEETFNKIWNITTDRSIWRKLTDYIAILLILPILMICSAGLSLLMSTTLQQILDVDPSGGSIDWLLDLGSYVFTCLFFAGAYMLIPNTKVSAKNALIVGLFVGIGFQILQWLFVTGQMYVAKYNAIYGSFSFIPLLLIWMQLVWLLTLIGALLCYASENAGRFNYYKDADNISFEYRREVILAVMAIIAKRFMAGKKPISAADLSKDYGMPDSLVTPIVRQLKKVGLINFLQGEDENPQPPIQPAIDVANLTVGDVINRLQRIGSKDFIPGFDERFKSVKQTSLEITRAMVEAVDETRLITLDIDIK